MPVAIAVDVGIPNGANVTGLGRHPKNRDKFLDAGDAFDCLCVRWLSQASHAMVAETRGPVFELNSVRDNYYTCKILLLNEYIFTYIHYIHTYFEYYF